MFNEKIEENDNRIGRLEKQNHEFSERFKFQLANRRQQTQTDQVEKRNEKLQEQLKSANSYIECKRKELQTLIRTQEYQSRRSNVRVNRLAKSRENWKDTEGQGGHIGRALKFSLNRTNKKKCRENQGRNDLYIHKYVIIYTKFKTL